jgi:Holliday junction resolvasome RuvABC endonuclease subunit
MFSNTNDKTLYKTRILSIDPGSNNSGVAVLELDNNNNINVLHVTTLNPNKELYKYQHVLQRHGERFAKFISICDNLLALLMRFNPRYVVCEAAYMAKFPQAYAVLTEEIALLRMTVYNYDSSIYFNMEGASSVKSAVGVSGKVHNKELVKNAIINLNLNYAKEIILDELDEHSFDAIAIGVSHCKKINSM